MKTYQLSEETAQLLRDMTQRKIDDLDDQKALLMKDLQSLEGDDVINPAPSVMAPATNRVKVTLKKKHNYPSARKIGMTGHIVFILSKEKAGLTAEQVTDRIKAKYNILGGKELAKLNNSIAGLLSHYSVGKQAGRFDREKVGNKFVYKVNVFSSEAKGQPGINGAF